MIQATTTSKLDSENPWPGLESYEESAHTYFCGREHEAEKLLDKVLDAPLTVLYGRSGLGKTSLLRAGLFPLLRERDFLPIYVRFELAAGAEPFTRQLHDAVRESVQGEVSDAMPPSDLESVWEYLHRADLELWSARNYPLTPVIVLDQFEELFTLGERFPDRVDAFRNDLGDLAENRIPAELAARIKTDEATAGRFNLRSCNYKLLISLREDFLPHLDEWYRLIPALGRSRMRLLRLQEAEAIEAVHRPAADLMTEELARQVVSIIAGADLHPDRGPAASAVDAPDRRRGTGEVEPALLSLVCRELNEERKRLGQAQFDERLVEEHGRKTLSNYYFSCVRDLEDTVKEFIEDELISEKGFRNSYPLDDAVPLRLTEDELDRLISSRLVRLVEYHGAQRIELTHDVLTPAVREHRDRRRAEREKATLAAGAEQEKQALAHAAEVREAELDRERRAERERRLESEKAAARRLRWLSVGLAVALVVAVVSAVVAWQAREEAQARSREAQVQRLYAGSQLMLAEQSRFGSDDVELMHMLLAAHKIGSTEPDGNYELLTTLNRERDVLKIIDLPAVTKAVAFSPDGTRIASGSDDKAVRLWNTDGQLVATMRHDDKVVSVAFSPDGTRIASGSDDKTVRLWNTDGQLVATMRHDDKVVSVAFSPDGTRIASAGDDKTVRLWNTDGQLVATMPHDDKVVSVAFSPDGTRIATGSADSAVRLWTADGKPVGRPMRHYEGGPSESVNTVAFSPDGSRIASASKGSTVRVWDVRTQLQIGELYQTGDVNTVAFSPDGSRIATGGNDRTISLWDAETGERVGALIGHDAAVTALAFGPDNRHLVSSGSDKTVRLWDSSWQPMFGHEDGAWAGFFDDGRRIGSGSWDKTVRWWEPTTGREIGEPLRIDDADVEVLFPVEGDRLMSFGSVADAQLWDARTGKRIGQPLSLTPDPEQITSDYTVSRLAVQLEPGVVQVYKTDTMRPIGKPILPTEEVSTVNFSRDGRILATGGVFGAIELWDTDTGARLGQPMQDGGGPVRTIAFRRNGQLLAAGHQDYTLRLWDTDSFQRVGKPMALEDTFATAVEFSPDGRTLASGGDDGTIRLWNVDDQTPLGSPGRAHLGSVLSLDFSPDGKRLLSASWDHTIRVWPVMPPDPNLLCAKLTHNMTRDHWNETVSPEIAFDDVCPNLPESEDAG